MKKLMFLLALLCLPLTGLANNFSQTFAGYADNTPIKIQLTEVDNHFRGVYDYKNDFSVNYIPNQHYIAGIQKGNHVILKNIKGLKGDAQFNGILYTKMQNGQPIYILKGQWQDKNKGIHHRVELRQIVFDPDTKNPIVNQFSIQQSDKDFYTIKLSYPLFVGTELAVNEIKINQVIKNFIAKQTQQFKQQVKKAVTQRQLSDLKKNAYQLFINNAVTNVQGILSIRFQIFESMHGAAHPSTTYVSFNFDTITGALLHLNQVFKKNSPYLQVLSQKARKLLVAKLFPNLKLNDNSSFDIQLLKSGTKANSANFKVWNVFNQNLLFTFPEYQVAAYVFGAQTIIMPTKNLMPLLNPAFFKRYIKS